MMIISESVQLQSITIEDHTRLMSLMKSIYPPAYKQMWRNEDCNFYFNRFYSFENLKKELAEPEAEYYFVHSGNRLVGILRLHFNKPLKSIPEKSACYFSRIYLSEEVHGKGIANELMKWVERKARLNGNELIWLEAMDTKEQALRFYAKHGFSKSHKAYLDFEPLLDHFRGMDVLYKILP